MPASYTLYELNEYIKRVIALNFPEPIWVSCEISSVKEVRGNVYIDLVHQENNEINAQSSAVIWYKSYLFLKNKLSGLLPSLLTEGTHVLIKVQVDFNERYGMKLNIVDMDAAYTIGQMEMNRQKILQNLKDQNLLDLNRKLLLPTIVQKIAVISAENAAGYIDFINHLNDNKYGYKFKVVLFPAAMQGQNTEKEVCQAIQNIQTLAAQFDCIAIIRGGGSKLDLAWFDNYNIGAAIAKSKLPVITGIGHDIDSTVTDSVAYASLKTPTAVADFILNRCVDYESTMMETHARIIQLSKLLTQAYQNKLSQITQLIKLLPTNIIEKQLLLLEQKQETMKSQVKTKLANLQRNLENIEQIIKLNEPSRMLNKGYTIIRQKEHIVKSSDELLIQKDWQIQFKDKTITIKALK